MRTMIYCKPTDKGVHSFYLVSGNEEYFLFSQSYRKGVEEYFGKGVCIDDSLKHSRAHFDTAICRTMDKIPMYVKYVEKEYEIEVFERTKRKSTHSYRVRCA